MHTHKHTHTYAPIISYYQETYWNPKVETYWEVWITVLEKMLTNNILQYVLFHTSIIQIPGQEAIIEISMYSYPGKGFNSSEGYSYYTFQKGNKETKIK